MNSINDYIIENVKEFWAFARIKKGKYPTEEQIDTKFDLDPPLPEIYFLRDNPVNKAYSMPSGKLKKTHKAYIEKLKQN